MTTIKRLLQDISTALQSQRSNVNEVQEALDRVPHVVRRGIDRAARQREQILAAADRQAIYLQQMATSIDKARQAYPLRWGS